MTEISKITSTNTTANIEPKKTGEIKPNETGLKQDTVDISSSKKNIKKCALIATAIGTAGSAIALAVMIGRNPAKAAKVLKGNSEFTNEIYKEGNKLADELLHREGTFKTSLNDFMTLFKPTEYRSKAHQNFADIEKYIEEHNLTPDADTAKALKELKLELNRYTTNIEQEFAQGKDIDAYKKASEFTKTNEERINQVKSFFEKQEGIDYNRSTLMYRLEDSSNLQLYPNITECPRDILPQDGTFFHGTKKAGKVYNNGFTNHASNQIETAARELGAGVYVTPDVGVASYFSGLFGNIIPVQMQQDAKIALVTENSHRAFFDTLNSFITERMPAEELKNIAAGKKNAMIECLTEKVFKAAGYDAAYIPKGVKGGGGLFNLAPNINEAIGKKQSQLIVYSPEKLEIAPRTLKERFSDVGEKFAALRRAMQYANDHPFGF